MILRFGCNYSKKPLKIPEIVVKLISVYTDLQHMDLLLKQEAFKGSQTPDLVLLDLNMPLMDGYGVLKET